MSFVYDTSVMGALMGMLPAFSFSMLVSVGTYVLTALALYTLAQRRGIHNPWLAWIPVANVWILGSLSDQYRYVTRGENRSKRKSLVALAVLTALLGVAMVVLGGIAIVKVIVCIFQGGSEYYLMNDIMGSVMGMLGLCVPLLGVAIAKIVIYYMALYDVYKSMDPNNYVVFLVLSILFRITEPFFLFFNRNKDLGMPPRREPVQETREPWENQ